MGEAGFWDNQEKARETVGELKSLNSIVKPMADLTGRASDIEAHLELADEDPELAAELPAELEETEQILADLELKGLLSGPYDAHGALMTINARDGGTDAHDWADMLLRMYS